jgi:TrmH family RNA methyltransferase
MELKTVTSRKNELLVRLKKLGQSRAFRWEQREFLCDGAKLLREACAHRAKITCVVCTDEQELPAGLSGDAPVLLVPKDVLESVSPLDSPQKVLFSCAMKPEDPSPLPENLILLENVQDPGNIGTVLRTANAFGCGAVGLVGACADPYGPKTLRASMGAVFRQRFVMLTLEDVQALTSSGRMLYGAALSAESRPLGEVSLAHAAVAVGSEGRGLSAELLSLCSGQIIIPMSPECESLNASAAAAVLLWEMKKQREGAACRD